MQTHGKQRPKTNSGRNKFSDAPRGASNAHASQMHAHPLFRRMYQRGWKLVPLMPIFHVCITYCVTLLSALPKASFYLGTQRCAQSVSMYVSFSGHARMHVYVCVCGRMYRFDALGNEPVFDTPVFPSSVILTKPSSSAVCDPWNDETD